MFLDICEFTKWPNSDHWDQSIVLLVLDVFLAEMVSIVRDHRGMVEKNTGDGLMAYFGTDVQSAQETIKPAVEAAVIMHTVADRFLNPRLQSLGLWPVRFRIGIDYGPVTVGRVGVRSGPDSSVANSFVAIGEAANVACRLLECGRPGTISIGDRVYDYLPHNWGATCTILDTVKTGGGADYLIWELGYRPPIGN